MSGRRLIRTSCVTGIAVFAAVSLAAGSAFAVTSPANALTPAAARASARPAGSAACDLGGTLLTPTPARTDKLGVRYYTYREFPGMVTKVPPSGLTAARVTPALLADIGLESASSAKNALTAVARQNLDRAAISLSAAGAPKLCAGTAQSRRLLGAGQLPRRAAAPSGLRYNVYADDWGGYGLDESEFGGGINAAEGAWDVGHGTTSGTSAYPSVEESTWVGVGSLDNNPNNPRGLIQAGVAMITDPMFVPPPGTTPPGGYTSWWEVVGTSSGTTLEGCNGFNNNCDPVYNIGDTTRPGDAVLVRVWYKSSSTACFLLVDYSHSGGDIAQTCAPSAVYDHTSAEWVNENNLGSGYLYNNPGTISFNTQNVSSAFAPGPWVQAFSLGAYQTVIMETDSITHAGVTTCPGGGVLLSKGVNASGQASQIATYHVNGCD
jgi:Peptidase A4 family